MVEQVGEHERLDDLADAGGGGVFFKARRLEKLFHLGGHAFHGMAPGQRGSLHNEMKPVPAGDALEVAALPVERLQILRVDRADVPRRKVAVVKRGAEGFSRQRRTQCRPFLRGGSGDFRVQFAPGIESVDGHRHAGVEPRMKQGFQPGVILRALAGIIRRGERGHFRRGQPAGKADAAELVRRQFFQQVGLLLGRRPALGVQTQFDDPDGAVGLVAQQQHEA